jgi:deazaflavin-dependent oxidoreductase (nitroreductase family)
MPPTDAAAAHFARKRPGWFTKNIFNRIVAGLTKLGLSILGSRVLEVKGRSSGLPRRTPVNLLELDGERYLVAPRGDTQWARNLRASGEGRLVLGRKAEPFAAEEITDEAEKAAILRAYLKRWRAETSAFFDRVSADASDEELRAIAPKHPVFRVRSLAR